MTEKALITKNNTNPVKAIRHLLSSDAMKKIIINRIGKKEGYFSNALIDLMSISPKLQLCDPNEVVMEALKAASMGLSLNPALGIAFLIPYNETVNGTKKMTPHLQLGYKSIVQLALRSGQFKYLNADCVYEGEAVELDRIKGTMKIVGKPTDDNVIGFYTYMQLINGFEKAVFMTPEQVHRHAKKFSKQYFYKSADEWLNKPVSNAVGWKGSPISMAIKTTLLRLKSFMPLSIEMQEAFAADKSESYALPDTSAANTKELPNGNVIDAESKEVPEPTETTENGTSGEKSTPMTEEEKEEIHKQELAESEEEMPASLRSGKTTL